MTDSVVGDGIDNDGVYLLYEFLCLVTYSVVGGKLIVSLRSR